MSTSRSKLVLTVAATLIAGTLAASAQQGGPRNEQDATGAMTDSSTTSAYPEYGHRAHGRHMVQGRMTGMGDAYAMEPDAYAMDDRWSGESDGIGIGIGVRPFGTWGHAHHHHGWRSRY